uniref:RUN domain-containing protein n=1 Tax=Mesocestoides corti TaxID=53468 RepID=A0A5K3FPX7_MESCO
MEIERGNILVAARFVVRELLDYVSTHQLAVVNYDVECENSTNLSTITSRLLCIIECGICHGLAPAAARSSKPVTSIPLPNPWPIISHANIGCRSLVDSVCLFDDIKTGLGRTRLWIRHALMSNLDVIDYRPCIRPLVDASSPCEPPSQTELEARLSAVIEQKTSRVEKLTADLADVTNQKAALESSNADYAAKVSELENRNSRLSNLLVKQSREVQNDLELVRETFKHSNLSLDNQNSELEKRLAEENKRRLVTHSDNEGFLAEQRRQNADLVALNREFSLKLSNVTGELEASHKLTTDLQEKIEGMSTVIGTMDERFTELKESKCAMEQALREAIDRANRADRLCVQLQTDLQANQEFTQNLQAQLDEVCTDYASVAALQENLDRKSQTLRERDAIIAELQTRCSEQEAGLAEMAAQVQSAQLRADRVTEQLRHLQTAQWKHDGEVHACTQCATPFSIARRKVRSWVVWNPTVASFGPPGGGGKGGTSRVVHPLANPPRTPTILENLYWLGRNRCIEVL